MHRRLHKNFRIIRLYASLWTSLPQGHCALHKLRESGTVFLICFVGYTDMSAKCGFCSSAGTKMEIIEPKGTQFKQAAICCASCNAVLGVVDYTNAAITLDGHEIQLKDISMKIDRMGRQLDDLERRR